MLGIKVANDDKSQLWDYDLGVHRKTGREDRHEGEKEKGPKERKLEVTKKNDRENCGTVGIMHYADKKDEKKGTAALEEGKPITLAAQKIENLLCFTVEPERSTTGEFVVKENLLNQHRRRETDKVEENTIEAEKNYSRHLIATTPPV